MHSRWGTFPFPVRMCIFGEAHPHSRWGCALPVRHIPILGEEMHSRWSISSFPVRMCIPIPSEDVHSIVIHPHQEWGCASLGMHILTGNGDVPHRERTYFIQGEPMASFKQALASWMKILQQVMDNRRVDKTICQEETHETYLKACKSIPNSRKVQGRE